MVHQEDSWQDLSSIYWKGDIYLDPGISLLDLLFFRQGVLQGARKGKVPHDFIGECYESLDVCPMVKGMLRFEFNVN